MGCTAGFLTAAEPKEKGRKHWALTPIRRPTVPRVQESNSLRNGLDAFVLRRLEREGVQPSPVADRVTLIRRATLDLIGLPPTIAEVDAFLAATRPGAYERLVDRLLASPHYGEKWARPWLDLCHYADSDGYLTDQLRPVAWRYRQWLVDALNRNLSFDEFTVRQIAGDLLPRATTQQKIATGFLRQTLSNREGGADLEEFRVKQVIDRTRMVGTVWLGLTVGCARCHDHKYDPISQREFFELYACLNNASEINIDAPLKHELAAFQKSRTEYQRRRKMLAAPIEQEINALQKRWEAKLLEAYRRPGRNHVWDRQWELLGLIWGGGLGEGQLEGTEIVRLPWKRRTRRQKDDLLDYFLRRGSIIDPTRFKALKLGQLQGKLHALKKAFPTATRAPVMRTALTPRTTSIHVRGEFRRRGDKVRPGTPACLPPWRKSSAPRLALARWLVSSRNPLTARVTVNRMWQEFFGRGIVITSEDFGKRGGKPSHPELLDWLATRFVDSGWDVKAMHRLIVTSSTYRQSSSPRGDLNRRDPGNVLLARQASLRVPAETVRDLGLAVSELLNSKLGGPSVKPQQPKRITMEAFGSNDWKPSPGRDRYRRGLYTTILRTSPFAQSATFDAPNPNEICTRRGRSNTPLQALTLLNDPVFFEMARAFAARVLKEQRGHNEQRIDYAFRLCVARKPNAAERMRLHQYLQRQLTTFKRNPRLAAKVSGQNSKANDSTTEHAAWTNLCSVLLNLHEFITRD